MSHPMNFHHAIRLRRSLGPSWPMWTQGMIFYSARWDQSRWFQRCYSLRADTIQCGLRIDIGTPQTLVARNESYHPDGWLTWVVPLLEQYVWPRQRRRAGWLAYRNFMDSIDWNNPVAPMPLEAAQFDSYGGLLESTGRLRVQGIDALTFSAICGRKYPVHHIQSRSLLVLMRRWPPKETHFYNRTTVPLKTWRVGFLLNKKQFKMPNARIRRLNAILRGLVRETFPGVAITRCDYMILPSLVVIDRSWDDLRKEFEYIAKRSKQSLKSRRS